MRLGRALERIQDLGQAETGDKSMVDALAPAVEVLRQKGGLEAALAAAEKGRDATVPIEGAARTRPLCGARGGGARGSRRDIGMSHPCRSRR